MKKVLRGPGMYLMLFLLIYLFARLMSPGDAASKELNYNEFMSKVEAGEILSIDITDNDLVALKKGTEIPGEELPFPIRLYHLYS